MWPDRAAESNVDRPGGHVFAIGMALNADGSYEDVFAQLTDGLSWSSGWSRPVCADEMGYLSSTFTLGAETVQALFRRVAHPVAVADTPGCWLAGRRIVAIDGSCLDVADTPENADHFGRRRRVAVSSPRSRKPDWWLWRVRDTRALRCRSGTLHSVGAGVGQ